MLGKGDTDAQTAESQHTALLQERAVTQQELETLPSMIAEFKRRTVLADFAYLQQVRSVAKAEAERINTEVDGHRVQQIAVQRQIGALTPRASSSNVRPLNIRDQERQIMVADREQRDTEYSTLIAQSRTLADEALPTVSSLRLAQLAADVAKCRMDNYTSHLGRAMTAQEAARELRPKLGEHGAERRARRWATAAGYPPCLAQRPGGEHRQQAGMERA